MSATVPPLPPVGSLRPSTVNVNGVLNPSFSLSSAGMSKDGNGPSPRQSVAAKVRIAVPSCVMVNVSPASRNFVSRLVMSVARPLAFAASR